jgi:urocanate hydratase
MGVVRHADAGYPEALAFAQAHGIDLPMQENLWKRSIS